MCMMQDPIRNCICNDRIIKYIIPRIKIYICYQNGASFFISQIYQLEEQFCIIFFNWQITQFINNQQLIFNNAGCSCAFSPICWDRNGECIDNTILLADDKTEGIFYAEFDMEAIRDYRNREMLGNTFRKVEAYSQLLSKEIKEPFIRPGQNELLKQSKYLN